MPNGYPFTKNYNHIAKQFDLTPTENNLLCFILSFQENNKVCTITLQGFASFLNVNEKSVRRAIDTLKGKNLIQVSRSQFCNSYKANENIIFNMDKKSICTDNLSNDRTICPSVMGKKSTGERTKSPSVMDKKSNNKIYLQDISIIRQQTDTPLGGGGRYAEKEEKEKISENEVKENDKPQYIAFD